jgi:iron-sulfur cluster repair protein YtfE (RIC family)
MATPEQSFAEALHEAHVDLLGHIQELEKAVGSEEPPAEMCTRLEKVRTDLLNHFRFEEDGGYMAPVLREEPRLGPKIQELLAEHGRLAQTLDALIRETGAARKTQDLRDKIRGWIGQVRHHEASENNLVQEAYYSSGATGD